MKIPLALVLCDLPLVGQQALTRSSGFGYEVSETLASASTTHTEVIDELIMHKSPAVRERALRRTTNMEAILSAWKPEGNGRCAAARNPLSPTEKLVGALDVTGKSWEIYTVYNAYINPSTPLEDRRQISPKTVEDIWKDGANYAARSMCAFTMLDANLWMMEEPTQWDNHMQVAIIYHPQTTKETLQKIYNGGVRGVVSGHPSYDGVALYTYNVDELLAMRSVAATTLATQRPELTFAHVDQILRTTHSLEPQILKLLIDRYGLGTLRLNTTADDIWITDICSAASGLAIGVMRAQAYDRTPYREAADVIKTLGDNEQNWNTFVWLLRDWHGSITQAAQTACQL